MINEAKNVQPPPPAASKDNRRRRFWLLTITFTLVVLALLWLLYWLLYLQYHQTTDDAYVNGNMISINSIIPGAVIAFYADDTDLVKRGQLLVELDSTDYHVAYEGELSTLASTVLQVRQLYNRVEANFANVESKKIAFERAQFDYKNRAELIGSLAVSNEDYIHAKDTFKMAESDLKQAQAELAVSLDAIGNSRIENHPLIEEQKAKVLEAYFRLFHTKIYAPETGYIAQRKVDVGESVSTTTNLMAIIPTDYVWVDANFKETQLTKMRVGQEAEVWFDMYGRDVKFQGKVLGIGMGSGSVFSVIPPQNATGNWIKIVQRLPVRIGLDKEMVEKYPLRLGISSEVNVNVTDQDLPYLPTLPADKVVSETDVFKIDFKEVEEKMDSIISENLRKD